jgi:hypothetical protein
MILCITFAQDKLIRRTMDERDYKAMNEELSQPSWLGAVSGSLGFDKGYEKGYNDATKEACQEIAKNYQPNDR